MVVTGEGGHESDTNHWLIDKSVLARLGCSAQAGEWALRIERGLVRITTVILLEVGNYARSASDLRVGLPRLVGSGT